MSTKKEINTVSAVGDLLDHDMALAAARLMEREGGSFARHIAQAYFVADTTNSERLRSAFVELFCKFYRQYRSDQITQEETK